MCLSSTMVDWLLLGLGALAHLICLVGLVLSFATGKRAVSLWFALGGLASVLAVVGVSWAGYRSALDAIQQGVSAAAAARSFEAQMLGLDMALASQTHALYAAALPFVLSLLLMLRGALLPGADHDRAGSTIAGVLTAGCVAAAAALSAVALLTYLDFGAFMYALFRWLV